MSGAIDNLWGLNRARNKIQKVRLFDTTNPALSVDPQYVEVTDPLNRKERVECKRSPKHRAWRFATAVS
jgi:pyrimidine operon attenuation protein/uracil phosphoribosyltransferase